MVLPSRQGGPQGTGGLEIQLEIAWGCGEALAEDDTIRTRDFAVNIILYLILL